jgi:hypothetical protein
MAAKKKTKKKKAQPKKTTRKKAAPTKKVAKKKPAPRKKAVKKAIRKAQARKPVARKAKAKARSVPKKPVSSVPSPAPKKQVDNMVAFPKEKVRHRSGQLSGDLQGLSDVQGSDSESVDELLEEGNSFEANVVRGVEEAGNTEGREVHTHEVSEDDIPGEYLDND